MYMNPNSPGRRYPWVFVVLGVAILIVGLIFGKVLVDVIGVIAAGVALVRVFANRQMKQSGDKS